VEHPRDRERTQAADRRRRLQSARLYLICGAQDDHFIDSALRGGADIVQLRCKGADDDQIVAMGRRFARLCAARGALFILNDRPDLVADAGADGAHVGQDDMQVSRARRLVGPQRLVGLSTHTPAQIDSTTRSGENRPDYIGVGPVYATPTKAGREAVGTDLVRYASRRARVPFFAIGGIDERTVGDVVAAGARRIAVVRALVGAADPETAARRLRSALGTKKEPVGAA